MYRFLPALVLSLGLSATAFAATGVVCESESFPNTGYQAVFLKTKEGYSSAILNRGENGRVALMERYGVCDSRPNPYRFVTVCTSVVDSGPRGQVFLKKGFFGGLSAFGRFRNGVALTGLERCRAF